MITYEKHTKIRRTTFVILLISLAIIIPLGFYILTVNETLSLKNLDKESYDSRMTDSFLIAFILFGVLLTLAGPFLFLINKMFNRYVEFIKTLNSNDIEKLLLLNEKENYIYKYMPPYIIKENTVTFFTIFRQTTISFNDITSINVRQVLHKGYKAFIVIRTIHNTYPFTLRGNYAKVTNLLVEAMTVNPKIINNKNWNY